LAVYGYHARQFSLAAPKLSCPMGFSVPEVFESVRCEAYGPGGAALLVDCLTDCRDRTVARVRQVLRRYGGNLGARDSVSYLFNHVGRLVFPAGMEQKRLTRVAWDAGAEDVIAKPVGAVGGSTAGLVEILTDPIDFEAVRTALQTAGFVPASAEITQRAWTSVPLEGEAALSMAQLLGALEDLNDVENVYTNAEIPDEVLARF
jgi:transcriptional/translational regulatory protein YebC/TACO1